MTETPTSPPPSPPPGATNRLKAYYELTKPGITGYVMISAGVAAYVAAGTQIHLNLAILTLVGTGLATGGALALNQYVERVVDGIMLRTKDRPLPSGRLRPVECLVFGIVLLVSGFCVLGLWVNWLSAGLAAVSAAAYHLVYTPLKTRHHLATIAGGVPGALPMLIGWTAVTKNIDAGGMAMFAIGYAWQLPHVLGLAWMLREDHAKVGFKLIPSGDKEGKSIGRHMVFWMATLIVVSGGPSYLGYTGSIYLIGALSLSIVYLIVGMGAARDLTDRAARKVFFGSLIYHPILLVLMMIDTVGP